MSGGAKDKWHDHDNQGEDLVREVGRGVEDPAVMSMFLVTTTMMMMMMMMLMMIFLVTTITITITW